MKALKDDELKKKEMEKAIAELKEKYAIRSFKTTTESITFTRKMAKVMATIAPEMQKKKKENISQFLDLFEPELIKYVVGTFVYKKSGKRNKPIDYEKEFVGDFESLSLVFSMTIEFLMTKAHGEGKQKAQTPKKIISKKRQQN